MKHLFRLPFLLFLLISISIPVASCPDYTSRVPSHGPLPQAPIEVQEAFNQVVESFVLYQTFLEADYQPDGTARLIHARNISEAHSLLEAGFTDEMVERICQAYTLWDPRQQELLLIPQDGLPTLSNKDRPRISFNQDKPTSLVFSCRYSNCYAPGDSYLFSVKAHLEESRWKISDLDLELINSGTYYPGESRSQESQT